MVHTSIVTSLHSTMMKLLSFTQNDLFSGFGSYSIGHLDT